MGTSSADPSRLGRYAGVSRDMNDALQQRLAALATSHDAVVPRLQWGVFDLSATFSDLSTFLQLNRVDDAWTATVARAFAQADSGPGPRTLADRTIAEALSDAGVPAGPRTDVTVDDPVMAGMPPTTGYADDPVCTATGHFLEVELDLPMPWRAGPLAWARTYTSRWLREGPFGRGWASWASVAAERLGDGAVEVVLHDGRRAVFLREPDGSFARVAGLHAALTDTDPGWELRFGNGDRWAFDASGLLVEVVSGVDRVVFERDAARLVRLVHSSGRTLDLRWEGERVVRLVSSDGREVAFAYDDAGDLVEAVRPGGVLRRYEQAGDGLIAAVVDADGVVECRNTYDADGRVLTQLSPHGRLTRFGYSSPGVTVVDDADGGPVATYVHDPAGRLVAVVDDAGLRQTTRYDEWGNPTAVTDRTGATTLALHDAWGRVLAVETPDGRRTSVRYDDLGRAVERTGPDGAVVRLAYDGDARWPSTSTDPLGAVTRLEAADGEVVAVTDPDGVTTRFERDADGLVVAAVDALGGRTVLERDPDGEVRALVDPVGRRSEVERDDAGRVVRRLLPGGVALALEWSAAGRMTASVAADGARTAMTWGPDGELARLVDPTGVGLDFEHDRLGRLARVRDGAGAVVEHEHDGLGRLVALVDPTGARWLREHDAEGRVTALVDPEGRRQERAYDELGRLVLVDDGAGAVTRFGYDAAGRLAAVTGPDGGTTTSTYDLAGRRTSLTAPDGATWAYAWSPAGRLQRVTSPAGRTTVLEHDAAGRASAVVGPDGARRAVERDAAGEVVASTGPLGERVVLEHDAAGRVVALVGAGGRVSREFDEAGRLVATTAADGARTSFGHDAAGRLASVTDALGGTTSATYDPVGALLSVTDPAGATSRYRHDPAGRLTGWSGADGQDTALSLDRSGRLATRTDATGTLTLDRDAAGRVVGWTDPTGRRVEADLDAAGRLVALREPERTGTRAYDRAGRLVRQGGLASAYDDDGLLVQSGPVRVERDAAGRASAVEGAAGRARLHRDEAGRPVALEAGELGRRWAYDGGALGLYAEDAEDGSARGVTVLERDAAGRVVLEVTVEGTRRYRYDEAGQLLSDGVRTWEYEAGRRVRETGTDGTTTWAYDVAGRLVRADGPAGTTHYAYDAAGRRTREEHPDGRVRTFSWDGLGRLRLVVDAGVRTELDVDALGDLVGVDGVPLEWDRTRPVSVLRRVADVALTGLDDVLAVGDRWRSARPDGSPAGLDAWGAGQPEPVSGPVALGLRGEVVVAGLVWLRGRVYDPATATFLSPDPLPPVLGAPTAASPYAYAGNDPVGQLDPLGLTPMTDADLRAYRDDVGRGLLDRTGDSARALAADPVDWVKSHGDALAAAGLVVVGGVLIATGVGAPIGVGILIGAGASIAGQIAMTGKVDARGVWISAASGALSGGVGGLFATSSVGVQVAAGAGADATSSALAQLLRTGSVSPGQLAFDAAVGGAAGGVGGVLSRGDVPRAPALDPGGHVRVIPGTFPDTHGVTFFHHDIGKRLDADGARFGRENDLNWIMPASDADRLRSYAEIVRGTGNAPGVERAVLQNREIWGLRFPVEGLQPRLPVTADAVQADGTVWKHFHPGGNTAVRQPDGTIKVNHDVREFVVQGGGPMPPGTVLVRMLPNGDHEIVKRY